jgi:serine/threonine protein kinase
MIRRLKDDRLITLKTASNNEALDYWLLQFGRPLTPFKDGDELVAVYREEVPKYLDKDHFECVKVIGKGGFSRVLQVRKKDTGKLYAMKIMNKDFIVQEEKVPQVSTERRIMVRMNHPFIVKLHWAFQTASELNLVMDFCPGGELFFHLHNLGRFTEDQAKFYFGEIVLGIEYLHSQHVVYRDLKPENILLDIDGHLLITDFGLSKENIGATDLSRSFCGSPEYMSPEMLRREGHGRAVDYYSLGALLYEMLTGLPPFYSTNRSKMYKRIQHEPLKIPSYVSKTAQSLISALLEKDPCRRLGSKYGMIEVKQHAWCYKIKWEKLLQKKILPPFRPNLRLSNFDPEYTSMAIEETSDPLLETPDTLFEAFDFSSDQALPRSSANSTRSTTSQMPSFFSTKTLSQETSVVEADRAYQIRSEEQSYMSDVDCRARRNTHQIPISPVLTNLAAHLTKRPREVLECLSDLEPPKTAKAARFMNPEESSKWAWSQPADRKGAIGSDLRASLPLSEELKQAQRIKHSSFDREITSPLSPSYSTASLSPFMTSDPPPRPETGGDFRSSAAKVLAPKKLLSRSIQPW